MVDRPEDCDLGDFADLAGVEEPVMLEVRKRERIVWCDGMMDGWAKCIGPSGDEIVVDMVRKMAA